MAELHLLLNWSIKFYLFIYILYYNRLAQKSDRKLQEEAFVEKMFV